MAVADGGGGDRHQEGAGNEITVELRENAIMSREREREKKSNLLYLRSGKFSERGKRMKRKTK